MPVNVDLFRRRARELIVERHPLAVKCAKNMKEDIMFPVNPMLLTEEVIKAIKTGKY